MKVITNADDLGVSNSINNTVEWLHQTGIVTSATIIAKSSDFEHAISIIKRNSDLGVGVHLCLDGPFNIGTTYKTLIDSETNQFQNIQTLIRRIRIGKLDRKEIFREYCLQIEKVLDNDIRITHLDHHHHIHIYPSILNEMIKAAKKYDIKYIRSQKLVSNSYGYNTFKSVLRSLHQSYLKKSLDSSDGLYIPGLINGFSYNEEFDRLNQSLSSKTGTLEIMLHPLSRDDVETRFFSSSQFKELIKSLNMGNYGD